MSVAGLGSGGSQKKIGARRGADKGLESRALLRRGSAWKPSELLLSVSQRTPVLRRPGCQSWYLWAALPGAKSAPMAGKSPPAEQQTEGHLGGHAWRLAAAAWVECA